jgi:hypothetical protein
MQGWDFVAKQVANDGHIQFKKKFVKIVVLDCTYWLQPCWIGHGWNQYDHEMPSINSAEKQVSFPFIVMKWWQLIAKFGLISMCTFWRMETNPRPFDFRMCFEKFEC